MFNYVSGLAFVKTLLLSNLFSGAVHAVLKPTIMLEGTVYTLDVVQLVAIFNSHYFLFMICGLLIFVAMIGSIVITFPFYNYPSR